MAEGRAELAAGRAARAASTLEEAPWRCGAGAPLADLAFEPFAQREITRLEDLHLAALELLTEAELALGQHAHLVERLERLVAEHPLPRAAPGAADARAVPVRAARPTRCEAYRDARRRLARRAGDRAGRAAARARARDPDAGPAARSRGGRAGAGARRRVSAFVGRERELAELTAGLDDAAGRHGRLFLLVGEPGIGKSRLAEELITAARARGALVLVGRCWEAGGAPAYWPWVQSLRAYVRRAPPDGAARAARAGRRRPRAAAAGAARGAAELPAASRDRLRRRALPALRLADGVPEARRGRGSRSCSCSTICTRRTSRRCCCCSSSRASSRAAA